MPDDKCAPAQQAADRKDDLGSHCKVGEPLRLERGIHDDASAFSQRMAKGANREHPPIAVQSSTFEQAKSDMETALGKHIESLLHASGSASKGHAA